MGRIERDITPIKWRISHRCVGALSSLLPLGGERACLIPSLVSGAWHMCTHTYKTHKKRHMPQRQAAGFNTVASVFKPGIPQWCQPCTHQAAGATGKGIAVSEGGQRDRRGAHFSRSSWLSRSGGKEHGDCFSSCSLWSRTRHSQYARNTRRGKKTHLWWYGPVFKVIVTFEFD